MRFGLRVLLASLAIIALVATAGCAKLVENAAKGAVENATGVKVDESKDGLTISGKDGKGSVSFGDNQKLPERFPSEVPVYEGNITTSVSAAGNDGQGFVVGIDTPDEVSKVYSWYETALADKGWTIGTKMQSEKGASLAADNGKNKLGVMMSESSKEGMKTTITLSVGPKTD